MTPTRYISHSLLWLILALALGVNSASAHNGLESEIEVRLLEQHTQLIVHMNPIVASILLDADAPSTWSEQIVVKREARLQELARTLFILRNNNQALPLIKATVSYEIIGQLAFVLTYPPITTGPNSVEAVFFRNLSPEFTGSLKVYGPPESPTDRQGLQIATLELTNNNRVLSIPSLPLP